ncbi:D-tyrosyl-tRNA(Tyr) deacylase [bacterium CG_4_9_14_3_um_filter_65_15]|nr:MAG: D-tyrosyl-tRNA(Tyr) deacylase [bacterium CG_4_9_14_3_um_filter_65_15]
MRCVVQRSGSARVEVSGKTVGSIDRGLVVLAAFSPRDTERELEWMAEKLTRLRVFNDDEGRMNLALNDVGGGILLISQFTLYGNIRKGTRPSFTGSAPGEQARRLYARFGELLRLRWDEVAEGEFGAHMQVSLVNDGPVTLILEREAPIEDES